MLFKRSKKYQRGFSTLEILLAMAVMVLTLSAAAVLSFGGQNLAADSQVSSEALRLAREMIESRSDLAKNDFRLVNPASAADGFFEKKIEVESRPFFIKKVKATVGWNIDNRPREIELVSLITDYGGTAGNDTCDSNLSGDWTQPQIKKIIDFNDFAESATSTLAVSGVDAYKNKLYVSVSDTADKNDPTFFVFDIADPFAPVLLNKIDNNANAKSGINALTVNGNYAYTASSGAEQLQIISLAANPPAIISSRKIIGGGDGKSIFYKNGYVYLGLEKNGSIPEFHIFNVNDLSNVHRVGGYLVGSVVNSIYVKNGYAYLAIADNNSELIVIDVSDRAAPVFYSSYDIKPDRTNWGYGKSVEVIGNKLYFGRTYIANSPEFYVFDIFGQEIKLFGANQVSDFPFSVNCLVVRDGLAFLATGSGSTGGNLKLYDISNLENIAEIAAVPFPNGPSGAGGAAMDCEGNNLFVGSVDGAGKSYLTVITSK